MLIKNSRFLLIFTLNQMWVVSAFSQSNPVDVCMAQGLKSGTSELAQCVISKRNETTSEKKQVNVADVSEQSNLPACPNSWTNETWSGCFGRKVDVNGRTYVGEFYANMREGLGVRYRSDGSVEMSGKWKWGDLVTPMNLSTNNFPLSAQSNEAAIKSNKANADSSKLVEKTKYLAEMCLSMGLKGGTSEFSQCVVQLGKIVPFDGETARQAREIQAKKDAELRQQEIDKQNAQMAEIRRLQEVEQLRRERESAQSQAAIINEIRRQQDNEQLNSIARNLLEIGRPQYLGPMQATPPAITPRVCNSKWNPISRMWQTFCD